MLFAISLVVLYCIGLGFEVNDDYFLTCNALEKMEEETHTAPDNDNEGREEEEELDENNRFVVDDNDDKEREEEERVVDDNDVVVVGRLIEEEGAGEVEKGIEGP